MSARLMGRFLIVVCLGLCISMLSACASSSHQIIDSNQTSCISCHSDREATSGDTSSAVSVPLTFTVNTDSDTVYLCYPLFGGDNGEKIIPVLMGRYTADGSVEITVNEEGIYAVCAGDEMSPSIQLVHATEDGDGSVEIDL